MQGGRLEAGKHLIFVGTRRETDGEDPARPPAGGVIENVADQAAAARRPRADSTSAGTSRISPT